MVIHEEIPIPVPSLLEPAYGEGSQYEEPRFHDFQPMRNFRTDPTFYGSSGAPIDSSAISVKVSGITSNDTKFTNLAYMKVEQIEKLMINKQLQSRWSKTFKKNYHVVVNDKLVVQIREDNTLKEGIIALDEMQRKFANISVGEFVNVKLFEPKNELDMEELEVVVYKLNKSVKLEYTALQLELSKRFKKQIMNNGQNVSFQIDAYFKITRIRLLGQANQCYNEVGRITSKTNIVIRPPKVFDKEIQMENIEKMLVSLGIGGIGPTFRSIIQKAFASRFLDPVLCKSLNISHVKGMVLHGPPGTGKTLLMRKLVDLLGGVKLKVVKGPELLVRWVGESEQNVRRLFSEAIRDHGLYGDESPLHIIVIDEFDSIARRRGQSTHSEVQDGIVSQLLTMIDGFSSMNNIFIIGTTNRLDLIDRALLRPGRLELLLEVGVPDERGRLEILKIHTQSLVETSLLEPAINLEEIDLAGLARFALSNAIYRTMESTLGPIDKERIKVSRNDFKDGIEERHATKNSAIVDKLDNHRVNALLDISHVDPVFTAFKRVDQIANQLLCCKSHHFFTCLLAGPNGCGKTTLAAHIVQKQYFKHVDMVQPESMIDFSEKEKSQKLVEIFEDSLKFDSSLIILDDIERLVGYTEVGQYLKEFSETLKGLLRKHDTKGIKVLVLGTTSEKDILEQIGISELFVFQVEIPPLKGDDFIKILQRSNICNKEVIKAAVSKKISLKELHLLIDLMRNGIAGGDLLEYLRCINMSDGKLAQAQAELARVQTELTQAQARVTERETYWQSELDSRISQLSHLHEQQTRELHSQIFKLHSQIFNLQFQIELPTRDVN
ncbi:vesicle-fusing ATPase-like isoform X2 [Quercus lobata]|uniref:vesicle-fusing ATPase-like isoform X2 n=1 Tax=Quercus lobata TaxID=97700 RepID=UPI001248FB34|nr:vesicle-fusing ATPase-like isoform X2 [Quercus lobata]